VLPVSPVPKVLRVLLVPPDSQEPTEETVNPEELAMTVSPVLVVSQALEVSREPKDRRVLPVILDPVVMVVLLETQEETEIRDRPDRLDPRDLKVLMDPLVKMDLTERTERPVVKDKMELMVPVAIRAPKEPRDLLVETETTD